MIFEAELCTERPLWTLRFALAALCTLQTQANSPSPPSQLDSQTIRLSKNSTRKQHANLDSRMEAFQLVQKHLGVLDHADRYLCTHVPSMSGLAQRMKEHLSTHDPSMHHAYPIIAANLATCGAAILAQKPDAALQSIQLIMHSFLGNIPSARHAKSKEFPLFLSCMHVVLCACHTTIM